VASPTTGGCSPRSDVSDKAPILWQYSFSNYNEKVRWALDYKSVPHRRRSLFPGGPRSLMFSRNGTLPVMDLDGERIVDSTRIIEALERRHPDPPLYPSDPDERSRALELEDFFDEHAGHDLRRIAFWDARDAPGWIADFMATDQPPAKRTALRAMLPGVRLVMRRRFAITGHEVERSRTVLRAALNRIESERSGEDHLVGNAFTVADLTAAALLYPMAWPPEFPYELPDQPPSRFLDSVKDHPALGWIAEIYRRHRPASAAV
jgi:glutathione S-transferase